MLCLISRMAILVAPIIGSTEDEQQTSVADFATKHQRLLETLVAGNLTAEEAGEAAALPECMLRLLQLRHRRQSRERFGANLITSIDDGGGKVRKLLKGDQQPDTYVVLLSLRRHRHRPHSDPPRQIKERKGGGGVWKRNHDEARSKACKVLRKAMAEAILAGDNDQGSGDLWSDRDRARAAASFRKNTSIAGDCWPLHEYAKVDKRGLDRFGGNAAAWKSKGIAPMQYLLNVMSMIPKKAKGDPHDRSHGPGWRVDTKRDQAGERAWNSEVADGNDSALPGSCCLHVMEDRQIFLDISRSLEFDTMQGLWDFVKSNESIDPAVLREELSTHGYGYTKTALTMLVHFAPMLLKFGKVFDGPTNSRGCGIVAGCGRSGSMARGRTVRTFGKLRTFCQKICNCNNLLLEEGKGVSTVVNVVRLQTSDKTVFIPPGPAADAALRGCQQHYCTAGIDTDGIDLGMDTSAGGGRDSTKLKARAADNKAREGRGNVVIQTLRSVGAAFQYIKGRALQPRHGQAPRLWRIGCRARS